MFAYCNNAPTNNLDTSGTSPDRITDPNAMAEGGYGPYSGYVYFPSPKFWGGTFIIGGSWGGYSGAGGSASAGIAIDEDGSVGFVVTGSIGTGTPSSGGGLTLSYSTAPEIEDLSGYSVYAGSSVNVKLLCIGVEYSEFYDSETGEHYETYTLLIGLRASLPYEAHAGNSQSIVYVIRDAA